MKKLLLFVCIFIISCSGANATRTIYYMNTGVPAYIQYGAGPKISYKTAIAREQAARTAMRHHMPARPRCRRNTYGYPYQYISEIPQTQTKRTTTQISRFDRNYKPAKRRSYNNNGITYYN